jgi:hypothetical protein
MSNLLPYWPETAEIQRCIKKEAESASDAVLLAVHQETPICTRAKDSDDLILSSENDLLDAFVTEDLPEGTLILPITGDAGAGKSHIVRWLAAKLEVDPRAKNFHIIRIPKSANLRRVVELILEPLRNDKKYDDVRADLKKAVEAVSPSESGILFSANLAISLEAYADQLEASIKNDRKASNVRDLKIRLDHARKLPKYFKDDVTEAHFNKQVFPRIVERAVSGGDPEAGEYGTPEFQKDDLKIPENVLSDLGQAAHAVQSYYRTNLAKHDDDSGFEVAVDVLNEVIDDAIKRLFRLNQTIGGVTIDEIIKNIREIFLKEGKELVILIEDFYALSGIQDILLKIFIQEAEYAGVQTQSRIRVALAVTDGYWANMSGRDTVLSRAGKEWIVQSRLSDEAQTIELSTKLIARYLNAARFGEAKLKDKLDRARKKGEQVDHDTFGVFREEDDEEEIIDTLNSFGSSEDRVPLFPFNRVAIRNLLAEHLKRDGKLTYNPRTIIDRIIRYTLLKRSDFERNAFPPSKFSNKFPQSEVAALIAALPENETVKKRFAQFAIIWGDNPSTGVEFKQIDPRMLAAFSLPSSDFKGPPKPSTSTPPETRPEKEDHVPQNEGSGQPPTEEVVGSTKNEKPTIQPPGGDDRSKKLETKRALIESWFAGTRLEQDQAVEIRKLIFEEVKASIDWEIISMKFPSEFAAFSKVYLPHARGNPSGEPLIVLSKDITDEDGSIRNGLIALYRREIYGGFDYNEAVSDTIAIDKLIRELRPAFIEKIEADREAAVQGLTYALTLMSDICGSDTITSPPWVGEGRHVLNFVIPAPPKGEIENSQLGGWEDVRQDVIKGIPELRSLLSRYVGIFQGGGDKVYAVDAAKLPHLESKIDNGLHSAARELTETEAQSKALRSITASILKTRSASAIKELESLYARLSSSLDDVKEETILLQNLRALVTNVETAALWPEAQSLNKSVINAAISALETVGIDATFGSLKEAISGFKKDDICTNIRILATLDLNRISHLAGAIDLVSSFCEKVDKNLSRAEENTVGISLEDAQVDLISAFEKLEGVIGEFQKQ